MFGMVPVPCQTFHIIGTIRVRQGGGAEKAINHHHHPNRSSRRGSRRLTLARTSGLAVREAWAGLMAVVHCWESSSSFVWLPYDLDGAAGQCYRQTDEADGGYGDGDE